MADIAESAPFTDPAIAISQGKRHLLVRDYSMAVSALAQACQLLAEKHGDTADELGEPYLLYGRALLGLAREEAGVLGGGVPGSEDAEEEDEEDEEGGDDEKLSNVDEKEEDEEEAEDAASNGAEAKGNEGTLQSKTDDSKAAAVKGEKGEKPEKAEASTEEKEKKVEQKEGQEKEEEKKKEEKVEKKEEAEKKEEVEKKEEKEVEESKEEKQASNKTDDNKIAEQKAQQSKTGDDDKDKSTPGPSKETNRTNEPSSSSSSGEQNGDVQENGDEDTEEIGKEDEEEVNNLQVAWEVLELAKLVLLKRGKTGWKLLADSYRLLGEVAMEGGNHQGALNDLQGCLGLLRKIEPCDPRAVAEIHYQLALAHSLGNDFDASIEEFNKATSLLEGRIKELEEMKEPPKTDDSFYTVEGEIQELKELLPEIQEKITDMKDFKQEACRLVIEGIKSKVAGGCSNGAGPSNSDAGTSTSSSPSKVQKPASDISHLVRKKRKGDEPETEGGSPCKKPTPEKAV